MSEHACPNCDYVASTKQLLQKHLNKRYPCDAGEFICNDCGKHFTTSSSLSHHKHGNKCKGFKLSRAQLEQKVAELTRSLKAIEVNTERAIVLYQQPLVEDEKEIRRNTLRSSEPTFDYTRPDLMLLTVGDSDAKHPQVYFCEPGPALRPTAPIDGIIIKFGETIGPYNRILTHDRDFEGCRLIDSVLCVNPKAVETEFKKWIKLTKRSIRAKSPNKDTTDTELFVVKSQDEYAVYVNKATQLAREYELENASHCDLLSQIKEIKENLSKMMTAVHDE